MKNQDKHPIDNYFKDYMEQDFPYNPSSWKKATMVIDAYFGKRKKAIVIIALFLISLSTITFFAFDTKEKPNATKQANTIVKKKNNSSVYTLKTEIDKETVSNVIEQTESSKDNLTPKSTGTLKQTDKEKIQINTETQDIPENHKDIPISMITESPDSIQPREKSIFFTDFVLHSKPLYSFNFNASNNNPQPTIRKPERKKNFAFMLELENLIATNTTHKLSGLSQAEIDYKKQYESIKNTNSYHINLIFQRGNFALISGLGYQNAIIKTDYLVNRVSYDTKILYKTENKFISTSSGSYLIIKTKVDTFGKKTEVFKIGNQANQNTFEYLLVPLKISYQYPYKRFRFSVRTGLDLSWLYNAKGVFINSDLKSASSIDTDDLKRFNANMFAQFMTGYQLNKRWQIGGSTYYSKQLGSNFKNYNSRFQNTGLGLYVRMGF